MGRMKNTTKEMLAVVDEIFNKYHNDPKQRCKREIFCRYTYRGKSCAVGHYLPKSLAQKADKRCGNVYDDYVWSIIVTEPKIARFKRKFWFQLQRFHDNDAFWLENCEEKRIKFIEKLKAKIRRGVYD